MEISIVVEGALDEIIARRMVSHMKWDLASVYIKRGKHNLKRKLDGYNNAARFAPWFTLVDLDKDADCAPSLRKDWLPDPSPYMSFRIAVREAEAWLLADRPRLSAFMGVSSSTVPSSPESETNPKECIVNIARRSRIAEIRKGIVPAPGSGRATGNAYVALLADFVMREWRLDVAARNSDSLRRGLNDLKRIRQAWEAASHSNRESR